MEARNLSEVAKKRGPFSRAQSAGRADLLESVSSSSFRDAAVTCVFLFLSGFNDVIPSQEAAATTRSAVRKRKDFFMIFFTADGKDPSW